MYFVLGFGVVRRISRRGRIVVRLKCLESQEGSLPYGSRIELEVGGCILRKLRNV